MLHIEASPYGNFFDTIFHLIYNRIKYPINLVASMSDE